MTAADASDTIGIGAAAEILGCSPDTLRRGLPEWIARRGFPRPLDVGTGRARQLRFVAATLIAWRDAGGAAIPAAPVIVDWHRLARERGEALDRGEDPDRIPALNPAP